MADFFQLIPDPPARSAILPIEFASGPAISSFSGAVPLDQLERISCNTAAELDHLKFLRDFFIAYNGNGPEGKVTDRFGICLYQNIPNHGGYPHPENPRSSRSPFKIKSKVKGRGTGQREKLPIDLGSVCTKTYPTTMANRIQKTTFLKVTLQGHPSRSNPRSKDGERASRKSYRPIWDLFVPKYTKPRWLAASRKLRSSRSPFKVKSKVKGRGTGQKEKLPTDLGSVCTKIYPTTMASRIQKTTFLKVTLQGQIQGQRTGNGPEGKVTDRFAICLYQNIPNHDG